MKLLPKTNSPLVIRTMFTNQKAWDTVAQLIRAPVGEGSCEFRAHVEFLDDETFAGLTKDELLTRIPAGYNHSFLLVVDQATVEQPEYPLLVIDLLHDRGRTFRAVPSQIQAIENNLSIANMDFFEFADKADSDGVFRGF